MREKFDYKDWLIISDSEREKHINSWNPYEGEGSDIVKFVADCFRKQYGHLPGILNVSTGIYHGGIYVIDVTIKKGISAKLPKKFLGFYVLKVCGNKGRKLK